MVNTCKKCGKELDRVFIVSNTFQGVQLVFN